MRRLVRRKLKSRWNLFVHASLYYKVAVSLFLVFSVTILVLTAQLENNMQKNHIELVKNELKSIATLTAASVDGDVVATWRKPEQQQSEQYLAIKKSLTNIKDSNSDIQDIYIMRKGVADRALVFLLEVDESEEAAVFNELYDTQNAPDILEGFVQPSVDREFTTDKWGMTLSGYAPIRNSQGEAVAIIGIDFDATVIQAGIEQRKTQILLYSLASMGVMLLISLILAKSIVVRLNRVKRAVDVILEDDLHSQTFRTENDEINLLAARVNNLIRKVTVEQEQVLVAIIMTLVNTLEVKDRYTHGHSTEVAIMTTDIMEQLEVDDDEKFSIHFAALLHDIGKIGIADNILNKTGRLTDAEFDIIRQHPVIGAKILESIPSLQEIQEIVKHHHERYDGRGYPDGVAGADIVLGARIIAVADSFQAMISDRPYRQGMSQAAAMEELARNIGSQFDPEVVEVFLAICQEKQYKT